MRRALSLFIGRRDWEDSMGSKVKSSASQQQQESACGGRHGLSEAKRCLVAWSISADSHKVAVAHDLWNMPVVSRRG